jgi:predicted deacetylase
MMKKGVKRILLMLLVIFFLIISLFFIRLISPKEIDDVAPNFPCDEKYLMKADILWVIPKFKNVSISENKEWCEKIISLNKTIGLHGVYHEYNEFLTDRNQEYLQEGINEFEKCFNKKPDMFKPPQLKISENNIKLMKLNNLKLKVKRNQIIHKVYHCEDTGEITNEIIDKI